ncbi:hypothetical protein [Nitratiruptor sp. SB155-2]|uniref:hypothetical protein n=1 Tax=Nitratiruptor sp. (strain SB155-2) TaxID=387092 RepID=UPI0001586E3B|nr:hypothetical protein [Nitratiruptor sp. SB155-2]BAF69449.1 conserved hypothetical protein [Nitratiruptor sp. SB155-2]
MALPKMKEGIRQADLANVKSKVTAIRSALQVEKTKNILKGKDPYPDKLDDGTCLFGAIFNGECTPDQTHGGYWREINATTYEAKLKSGDIIRFIYNPSNGTFTCVPTNTSDSLCNNF